jgi:hypothetical protein
VPQLTLILRDLYPAALSPAASAALPRLPSLERWLAQGVTDAHGGDWRQWLQRLSAESEWHAVPPASVAAAAIASVPAGHIVWLATPVHFVAGLDTLRVHPAGLLDLPLEEQRALALDFSRVFAGAGWSLHATGRRELLLAAAPEAGQTAGTRVQVRTQDPALWLGADPSAGLPAGAGAAPLRRFGAELEMWLHEHAINRSRVRRGLLNANALWLWGGGAPVARSARAATVAAVATAAPAVIAAPRAPVRAWAQDLFVDGLAQLTGALVEAPPARWPAAEAPAGAAQDADRLVVCEFGAAPDQRTLADLERDWIAPALEQWRRGSYRSATLLAGSRAVTLERAPLRQFWRALRRTRPWWETLLQC